MAGAQWASLWPPTFKLCQHLTLMSACREQIENGRHSFLCSHGGLYEELEISHCLSPMPGSSKPSACLATCSAMMIPASASHSAAYHDSSLSGATSMAPLLGMRWMRRHGPRSFRVGSLPVCLRLLQKAVPKHTCFLLSLTQIPNRHTFILHCSYTSSGA